jgi:hypothetical protein
MINRAIGVIPESRREGQVVDDTESIEHDI